MGIWWIIREDYRLYQCWVVRMHLKDHLLVWAISIFNYLLINIVVVILWWIITVIIM